MADWTWALANPAPSLTVFRELTEATSRRVTWRLDATDDAQFSMNGESEELAEIVDLATDLVIYRNGIKLHRGRLGPAADSGNANGLATQLTSIGYRGMLDVRHVPAAGATYTATDQAQIAFGLIDTSQSSTNGDWGITDGTGATSGTTRDRTYDPGKPIGEALGELFRVDDGGEWEIDADLALNRWYPTRGTDTGVVLDFGGLVVAFERLLSPADFGNAGVFSGDTSVTDPIDATAATLATDPRGRWEVSRAFPSIKEQATLVDRAAWVVAQAATLRPTWRITLAADAWEGPDHLWLGDTAQLAVHAGRLAVDAPHRIAEIAVTEDDNGVETVVMGLIAA